MKYHESFFFKIIMIKLYSINHKYLRMLIRRIILKRINAEFYSETLRLIFSKFHNINIGLYSYGIFDVNLYAGLEVGRYTSIAKNFKVLNGSHPVNRKSSHPFFYNPDFGYVDELLIKRRQQLIIGNDVYIGFDVTIMPNVTSIGNGAVIAAGSVVVKNVPPYAIIGGNPAVIIKYRFSEKIILELVNSNWWLKSIEELTNDSTTFQGFLKSFE